MCRNHAHVFFLLLTVGVTLASDVCNPNPCHNGGSCSEIDQSSETGGQYLCTCVTGWTGSLCSQVSGQCYCDEYSECVESNGHKVCECRKGYVKKGDHCVFTNLCESHPCKHGYCTSLVGGYQCLCEKGWAGVNCSEDVDECSSSVAVCDNIGGVCVNTNGSYSCRCKAGWYGNGINCTEIILYKYDTSIPLTGDDVVFGPYRVPAGFVFGVDLYHDIFVSTNGFISFGRKHEGIYSGPNNSFPADTPLVAPFWSDLDLSADKSALYIDTHSEFSATAKTRQVFERFRHDSLQYGGAELNASYMMLATWHHALPYPAHNYNGSVGVTFQVVLATDSHKSAVLYNYDSRSEWPGATDFWPLLGFSHTGGFSQLLPVKDSKRPDKFSNVDKLGRYFYNVNSAVSSTSNIACLRWYHSVLSIVTTDSCPCNRAQAQIDFRFKVHPKNKLCFVARLPSQLTCCYDSTHGVLQADNFDGDLTEDDSQLASGYTMCCVDSKLCHLFHEKYPPKSCSLYDTYAIGAMWGYSHYMTLDGATFSFAGLGEFLLLHIGKIDFTLQMRSDIALGTVNNFTTTALVALAVQEGISDVLEVKLDNSVLAVYSDGVLRGTSSELNVNSLIQYRGVTLTKPDDDSILVLFQSGIAVEVFLRDTLLNAHVMVPTTYKTTNVSGLLGGYDGNADNDFPLRNGQTLHSSISSMTAEQVFDSGQNWTLQRNESLFNHSSDDGQANRIAQFRPTFVPHVNNSIQEKCSGVFACLHDYLATNDTETATASRDFFIQMKKYRNILNNRPPKFGTNLPTTIKKYTRENYTLTLNVTDLENNNVTLIMEKGTGTLSNSSFSSTHFFWPAELFSGESTFLKFYAFDADGAAALYWPTVELCACSAHGRCTFEYLKEMEHDYSKNKFYVGFCDCEPGFQGRFCDEPLNECDTFPCYPGVACSNQSEGGTGYRCASCPSGFSGDGRKCKAVNHCVENNGGCHHVCVNEVLHARCVCHDGFTLLPDNKTCKDTDECVQDAGLCNTEGMYCTNTDGSYVCACRLDYLLYNNSCIFQPRQFKGQIQFEALNVGNAFLSWTKEMKNSKTEQFKMVANYVESMVNSIFNKKFDHFRSSHVYNITHGSLRCVFDIIFEAKSTVTAEQINSTLLQYFQKTHNCSTNGPDCNVDRMLAVELAQCYAEASDLCLNPEMNHCDSKSTQCINLPAGRYECQCKAGFQHLKGYPFMCQDINECENESMCDIKNSYCVNLPGSYQCLCLAGFRKDNNTCLDTCIPNPCDNDGICIPNEDSFICKCVGIWTGVRCEDENEEANRFRVIAISVGVGVGLLCLFLLLALLVAYCKLKHAKRSYGCEGVANYNYGNHSNMPFRVWEPSPLQQPHDHDLPMETEMTENGNRETHVNRDRPMYPEEEEEEHTVTTFGRAPGKPNCPDKPSASGSHKKPTPTKPTDYF